MKKLLAILLIGIMTIGLLTGCGDSSKKDDAPETSDGDVSEEASIVGDWYLSTIEDGDGNQFTLEEYCASVGVDTEGVECTYTFAEDGTVVGAIGGVGVEGTYTFDGTTLSVTFNGTESVMNYDADQDIIYASDATSGYTSYMERS